MAVVLLPAQVVDPTWLGGNGNWSNSGQWNTGDCPRRLRARRGQRHADVPSRAHAHADLAAPVGNRRHEQRRPYHRSECVLQGELAVSFAIGFHAGVQPGDTFTLLSTVSPNGLTGTFNGLANGARFLTADGFGTFQVNYTGNALLISNFAAVPEPSTYVLIGFGAAVMVVAHCRRRSRPNRSESAFRDRAAHHRDGSRLPVRISK